MSRALTTQQIAEARELRDIGITDAAIARTFDIARSTIRKALQDE